MPTQPSDATSTGHLLCRVCNKGCPLIAEVRDGRLAAVRGDRDNELFEGYTCVKGRALPAFANGPGRLLRSLRRSPGGFEPIAVATAMDEIAARLSEILGRYGPRSIATYYGTQLQNVPAGALMRAFSAAIGSDMNFAASSLDKPGRSIAWAMLGKWQAPPQGFCAPDVVMMLGINPFVNGLGGIPAGHPGRWLSERLGSGMELIVIDPRRSDIAKRATLFLQPRPGHDIPILAAMLNLILTERLHDQRFTAENVRNLDALAGAVRAFGPRQVAARSGLEPADLERAARVFAGPAAATWWPAPGRTWRARGRCSNTSGCASTPYAAIGCGRARWCRTAACSGRRPCRGRRRPTRSRLTGSAPGPGSAGWG